jgi:hypothetical protein
MRGHLASLVGTDRRWTTDSCHVSKYDIFAVSFVVTWVMFGCMGHVWMV